MAKSKAQKKDIVKALTEKLKQSKLIVVSEIKGLNVSDTTKLRSILRKQQISHQVAKLTLLKIAMRKAGIKTDELNLQTQVAVTLSGDDTDAARELKKFSAGNDKLKMLCGFLDGQYLDQMAIRRLASVPTRMELLGQLVGVLSGPARGVVTALSGNLRGLVQVLSQVKR
jgi:large subunit ribosomal protein L10